jgi:transposase-like protein
MIESRKKFSSELKKMIVLDIESGVLSLREASERTRAGVAQIKQWLEEFGQYRPKRDVLEVVMKSEADKIAELEKAVADLTIRERYLEKLVELAGKEVGMDLKKNYELLQSRAATKEKAVASPSSAKGPKSAVRGTTSTKGGGKKKPAKKAK